MKRVSDVLAVLSRNGNLSPSARAAIREEISKPPDPPTRPAAPPDEQVGLPLGWGDVEPIL